MPPTIEFSIKSPDNTWTPLKTCPPESGPVEISVGASPPRLFFYSRTHNLALSINEDGSVASVKFGDAASSSLTTKWRPLPKQKYTICVDNT